MEQRRILLCAGTGCISSGALKARDALLDELDKRGIADQFQVVSSGCHGFCEQGPLFIIHPEDIFYCGVHAEDMPELVEEYLVNGRVVERLLFKDLVTGERVKDHTKIDFYAKQMRLVLHNCGVIDPENIHEYLGRQGYEGLKNALKMDRIDIITEVKKSGLRGRGGAGFPTGMKWDFTYKAKGDKKYIVCNADEGDPGAFMDRSVLEGDPHAVIEGMLIAGFAIGSDEGYVYCRAEYPLAIKRLRIAIEQANKEGFLGENILGSDFSFHLKIKEGAGAFVCGEETALLASIEGERGMPRPRPPFPANSGLWAKPTCLNNVETLANIPLILREGAEQYASVGTERSTGTKVFALTGKINNTGLAEVPMGISLREIIFGIGGGVKDGKQFKAVQIGGPSGGCLPEDKLDLPVDYDSLTTAGAIMGSGGLVVMDENTCMVDLARFFLTFTQNESCGKCTPCREGTKRMLETLERITDGKGVDSDIDMLEDLASSIKDSSLCGLGQTAPNPVLSTLRYFRHEYEEHIHEGKCRAGVCTNLVTYSIHVENCIGCRACTKVCPVDAISGEKKEPHAIDIAVCIKCGACFDKCKFDAVIIK
jgi:NADH:ubiquinone oxidoreductase subunit F (NADH-binding)/(2Fe-2S) ferredoxin